MILTTLGMMDEADLHKRTGGHDDPDETVEWVEYRYNGEVVHRSAHVTLKKSLAFVVGVAADFGG